MKETVLLASARLNERRIQAGLSQVALGKLAGLTNEVVGAAVHGRPVSLKSANKLAVALGIPINKLITGPADVCGVKAGTESQAKVPA